MVYVRFMIIADESRLFTAAVILLRLPDDELVNLFIGLLSAERPSFLPPDITCYRTV